ncbi:unnamed protein product [Closterium sp. NIES-54]
MLQIEAPALLIGRRLYPGPYGTGNALTLLMDHLNLDKASSTDSKQWHSSHGSTALHCTALHCTALHCTALHCTAT